MKKTLILIALVLFWLIPVNHADACTNIIAGKKATTDGSLFNSHLVDSHRSSPAINIAPRQTHKPGSNLSIVKRVENETDKMQTWKRVKVGEVPQVPRTHRYFSTPYPAMNEHQLAIGESTFGGREELKSDKGLFDCQAIIHLMMQRTKTAREAIAFAGEMLETHGWNDVGEALTITDKNEAWIMEIVGPGEGKTGAVWAAQRVPDDHVAVTANSARIRSIILANPDRFMASKDIVEQATEMGYYDPQSGLPFQFAMAFAPEKSYSKSSLRRIWRVLDMMAPSLKLHPEAPHYPLSVKPDEKVDVQKIMAVFRDYYEGTPYDMTKGLTVTDKETGKTIISPLANPWMPYDANKLHKINGGWGWRGERTLARWYTMYATILQTRDWLPDPVGGVVWFGLDNTAMTTWVPISLGVDKLPSIYTVNGRKTGFSRKSAWWAFNRVATLSAQRWGNMQHDVATVRDDLQKQIIDYQAELDKTAVELHKKSPKKASAYLSKYLAKTAKTVTDAYWDLGDLLWTKYDEKW